jgi:hypothetical protein
MQPRISFLNLFVSNPDSYGEVAGLLCVVVGKTQAVLWSIKLYAGTESSCGLTDNSTEEQRSSEFSLKQSRYKHIISYPANSCDLNTHAEASCFDSGGILGATARICEHESLAWLGAKRMHVLLLVDYSLWNIKTQPCFQHDFYFLVLQHKTRRPLP